MVFGGPLSCGKIASFKTRPVSYNRAMDRASARTSSLKIGGSRISAWAPQPRTQYLTSCVPATSASNKKFFQGRFRGQGGSLKKSLSG